MALDAVSITGADVGDIEFDGTTYGLSRPDWRPTVARRQRGQLGGRPYEDVVETIPIVIQGVTKAAVKSALNDLIAALDQAERWSRGEAVSAVLLNYDADGAGSPLQTAILGVPRGFDFSEWLALAGRYRERMDLKVLPLTLRLVRRGEWLAAEESSSSTPAPYPVRMAIGLNTSQVLPSPLRLKINFTVGGGNVFQTWPEMFVMLASATNRLLHISSHQLASGAFTSVADAANQADGNILRYTPTGTTEAASGTYDISGSIDSNARRFAIYANFRTNGAASYDVRFLVRNAVTKALAYTRLTHIPTGTAETWVYCGSIATKQQPEEIAMLVTADASGGPYLDSDSFVILALDDEASRCIKIPETVANDGTLTDIDFYIDHQELTKPDRAIYFDDTVNGYQTYVGNVGGARLLSKGAAVVVFVAACDPTPTYWTMYNGTATHTLTATAYRRPAYLVPQ